MGNPKSILIAEDEQISYKLLSILINHIDKDMIIFRALNGQEAIDIFQQNQIDLILMDVKMPVMDGAQATYFIRTFDLKIPIIAQTAFTQKHELEIIINAGVNEVLAKPIHKADLINIFDKYL